MHFSILRTWLIPGMLAVLACTRPAPLDGRPREGPAPVHFYPWGTPWGLLISPGAATYAGNHRAPSHHHAHQGSGARYRLRASGATRATARPRSDGSSLVGAGGSGGTARGNGTGRLRPLCSGSD